MERIKKAAETFYQRKSTSIYSENANEGVLQPTGFTLVEIIVVLVIITVLAAATIPTFMGYLSRARLSNATADANMLAGALNVYNSIVRVPDLPLTAVPTIVDDIDDLKENLKLLNLLPKLEGDFEVVLNFIDYDDETKQFEATALTDALIKAKGY